MGVKISWDSQAGKGLDAVEVYRSKTKIDPQNPGTPLAVLDPNLTSYEDFTAVNKNLYYYCLAAKKGTERSFGTSQLTGYFSETGPGNASIARGSWNAGFMDRVPSASLITGPDLAAKLTGLVYSGGVGSPTSWYKFAYKGRILFYPDAAVFNTTWSRFYDAGMVFGTDDFGKTPAGVPGSVNQKRIVEINGLQYIVRLAKLSEIDLGKYLSTQDDTIASEYRSTLTRLVRATVEPQAGAGRRLGDLTSLPVMLGQHLTAPTMAAYAPASLPASVANIAITSNLATAVVLELIMP
ncbi:putative virion structural protein [Salmonella phage pSal-SNUABM-04]|nr:putative virion structural protein [Salmonella phage pSal-SNUABM-04]